MSPDRIHATPLTYAVAATVCGGFLLGPALTATGLANGDVHSAPAAWPFIAFAAVGLPYTLWLWTRNAPCVALHAGHLTQRRETTPPNRARRIDYGEIGDVILYDHPEDSRDRLELHLGGGTRVRIYTCNFTATAAEICAALAARGVAAAADPTVR